MNVEFLMIAMLGGLMVLKTVGVPLAFALGGMAVIFIVLLWGPDGLFIVGLRVFTGMGTFPLAAVPMFIFMGLMLEKSGIADDLYGTMHHWLGSLRGGLSMGTVLICTLFAAMSGVSATATVTMGVIALPAMFKRGYHKNISIGGIAAGGALGVLIPPSVMMIVLALFAGVSVGRLFLGGVLPGLLLAFLFCLYIGIRCAFQRHLGPPIPLEEKLSWGRKFLTLRSVILPISLVVLVLGSIFGGVATPTEASAVGAFGSVICTAIHRKLNWQNFKKTCLQTLYITVMVQWVFYGAVAFTSVFTAMGATALVKDLLVGIGGRWGPMIVIQVIYFILGMIIDPLGIIVITAPLFFPVVRVLGFDPIWFGVITIVNLQTSFITPPFGYSLFYLKGVVPKGVSLVDIFRSVVPFVVLQLVGLILCIIFPEIVMFLPNLMS